MRLHLSNPALPTTTPLPLPSSAFKRSGKLVLLNLTPHLRCLPSSPSSDIEQPGFIL